MDKAYRMSGMLKKAEGARVRGGISGETSTCKCPGMSREMDSWPVWLGQRQRRGAGELETRPDSEKDLELQGGGFCLVFQSQSWGSKPFLCHTPLSSLPVRSQNNVLKI